MEGVGEETPTIYEWGGGREPFERWLNAFYDLVEDDELIAPLFGGKVSEEHRDHVTTWWCEVMGGPPAYTEEHGGYRRMLARHHVVTWSRCSSETFPPNSGAISSSSSTRS